MADILLIVVYGAFALGYVAMLFLTERSADRYVRAKQASSSPIATTHPSHAPRSFLRPSQESLLLHR